jgi:NAD-dependent dihydropyrimidine dehydrogenase PreA subunit
MSVEERTLDGLFIDVEVSPEAADDPALAATLAEVCPVDIFADHDGHVQIVAENLDECVLCRLCVDAAPPGAVRVIKRYDGDAILT